MRFYITAMGRYIRADYTWFERIVFSIRKNTFRRVRVMSLLYGCLDIGIEWRYGGKR